MNERQHTKESIGADGLRAETKSKEKKALLVIDMQNDYLWSKRKEMFSYDTEKLVGNVNQAIEQYQEEGYDIIYIKQFPEKKVKAMRDELLSLGVEYI